VQLLFPGKYKFIDIAKVKILYHDYVQSFLAMWYNVEVAVEKNRWNL